METSMRAQRERIKLLQDGKADKDTIMVEKAKYQGQLNEYSRFCKKMGFPQERERIYLDGLGRTAPSKFRNKTVAVGEKTVTIKEKEMFRKTQNTGAFKHLPERMSKKHIREIAKKFDIDLQGLKLNIDFNEELLRIGLAERADPEELGGITFFPNSFRSKEELVRTLFHEKQRVEQFKEFGIEYVQENRLYFERLTETLEEEFVLKAKKEGKL